MTYRDVGDFHAKFDLPHDQDGTSAPHLINTDVMFYRCAFLIEELLEIMQAHQRGDLAEVADGLVDLVYIAFGTGHMMHLPWQALWDEVQRANMTKERGPTEARGHKLDVRKPDGWVGPDIEGVLRAAGWTETDAPIPQDQWADHVHQLIIDAHGCYPLGGPGESRQSQKLREALKILAKIGR